MPPIIHADHTADFSSADQSPQQLSIELKAEALRIGFDLVGIAPAVSPEGFHPFQEWLRNGHAGEMQYLERREEAYVHPQNVLESVRSVVMLAVNYNTVNRNTETVQVADETVPARVSRYAWGSADYHDVIRGMLRELGNFLHDRIPGCHTRGTIDTAPLLERDFSRLAGLGWFGKNTMLINKKIGSWLFLSALLTDVELGYDSRHDGSHCGTCTRCLDVCPTDAFTAPYVLDARRCISYLTIELRSPIPHELRSGMEDWLFGCDLCQEVCPWNNKAPQSTIPEFQPSEKLSQADALHILQLNDEQFREQFRKTPLTRPKRAGILRNAAIVVGNHFGGDSEKNRSEKKNASQKNNVIETLITVLSDHEPLVRGAVAWALGQVGGEKSLAALQAHRQTEETPELLDELDRAIQQITIT